MPKVQKPLPKDARNWAPWLREAALEPFGKGFEWL